MLNSFLSSAFIQRFACLGVGSVVVVAVSNSNVVRASVVENVVVQVGVDSVGLVGVTDGVHVPSVVVREVGGSDNLVVTSAPAVDVVVDVVGVVDSVGVSSECRTVGGLCVSEVADGVSVWEVSSVGGA